MKYVIKVFGVIKLLGTPYVSSEGDTAAEDVSGDKKSKSLHCETVSKEINHQSPLHLKYHHTNVDIPKLPSDGVEEVEIDLESPQSQSPQLTQVLIEI